MPLIDAISTRTFHRTLYGGAGYLEKIKLYKRGDDLQQGTVVTHILFECILPGTKVSGLVKGVSKARYAGEAVELRTAGGTVLSTTVNHPVLTPRGFVPAGQLEPGDYLVNDQLSGDSSSDDIENSPTLVEEVFEALAESGSPVCHRPSPFEFHGDGESFQGDVHVVRADGGLLVYNPPTASQEIGEFGFHGGYLAAPSLGFVDLVGEGLGPALGRSMGVLDLVPSLSRSHTGPLELLPFRAGAKGDTGLGEYRPYAPPAHAKPFGKRKGGFSRQVKTNNFVRAIMSGRVAARCFGVGSRFNASLPQSGDEGGTSDSSLFGELRRRFPGEVATDKLVKINRFHYDGPVYDLETSFGYYTAAALGCKAFISNCRRSMIFKTGETILGDMLADHRCVWHIPRTELDRVGIAYLNPLDRIEQLKGGVEHGWTWQVESDTQGYTLKIFGNHYCAYCKKVDPTPSGVQ